MKTKFIAFIILVFSLNNAFAQKVPYNVVFDITSGDTAVHQMAMRWVREILSSNPDAKIELVFYGKSLEMITKNKSVVADSVAKYAGMKNILFRVCEIALKNNHVEANQLIAGVKPVPDGIYEIVLRQNENWGYIKVSR